MTNISKHPEWNALLWGREYCLVKKLTEYYLNEEDFQDWLAIYDIKKAKKRFAESTLFNTTHSFIAHSDYDFVILTFTSDVVNLLEDNAKISQIKTQYCNSIENVLTILAQMEVPYTEMQQAWRLDYPFVH